VWERPIAVRVITVLAVSYVLAAVWQVIKNAFQFYYFHEFEAVDEYGYMAYINGIIGYSYFLFLCWSGMYFGLKFYRLLQEEKEKSIRAESQAHESQLRMLRYQLNPHFLFNTLNAISTLILEKDTELANAMVSKLSNFLRYSLDKDPMQKVDLEHEINTMNLYLEIEQVRFDERLRVVINIDDAARKALVPSLLLQPMVENSIKYAVANRVEGGKITITGKVFAGDLLLEISDDGPGIPTENGKLPKFTGVGLTNTQERLQELYGAKHSCKIGSALPHGLKIEIRVPFETE
jgi:LytS/YehU family sensor histidine kinase